MKRMTACLIGVLVVCLYIVPAHATLFDGQTIEAQFLYPNLVTPYGPPNSSVVGSGVEIIGFPVLFPIMNIDYSDTNILMTMTYTATGGGGSFNGIRFTDSLSLIAPITSVTLNSATTIPGMTASYISFDADHIWINFDSIPYASGQVVSLDVTSVPEPTTLLLLGLGLIGLAGVRRKFKK